MPPSLTLEEFIVRSKNKHGEKYDYNLCLFTKVTDKVKIICPLHGEFEQMAVEHYKGRGCFKCGVISTSRKLKTVWTESDDLFLINNYPNTPLSRCSLILGKDRVATKTRIINLGIKLKEKPPLKSIPYKEFPGYFWSNLLGRVKESQLDFNLSLEYLWSLYIKQNKKCALTGWDLYFSPQDGRDTTASLDRIDSSKGYIEGNVQFVFKQVNKCKLNCSEELFYNMCKAVYFKNNNKFDRKEIVWESDYLNDTEHPEVRDILFDFKDFKNHIQKHDS